MLGKLFLLEKTRFKQVGLFLRGDEFPGKQVKSL